MKIDRAKLLCCLISLLLLSGCQSSRQQEPTPEGAKQFLKLRGYQFDEKSFLDAVTANDVLAANAFLTAGINPNAKNESDGDTGLILAAGSNNLEMVNALLKGHADVNLKNKNGFSALSRALIYNHEDVSQLLLRHPSIDINVNGANGASTLIVYVLRDREDVVKDLVARGANLNAQDVDGDTALHCAVKTGNVNLVKLLIEKGASIKTRDKLGSTPLMWAGGYGQDQAARILLEHGADPNEKDDQGRNAAQWADDNAHHELGDFLRDAMKH